MRKPAIKTLIENQKLALKASSPKARDKNRARLKILQVRAVLGKKPRRAA